MSNTNTTDERDLGQAGEQLSTAPREEPAASLPSMGVIGWARWFWRQLTSMRVALILLFMLSLGAIPGSLIPQNSVDELKVQTFKEAHTTVSPVYEKLQFFDVYSSVWFSAIYILLFVSLIGCIVPRTWQFVGQLRGRPPGAPKKLTRLPAYTTWRTDAEPEQVREVALSILRRRRFRSHVVGDAVAAEKGYLRETGNLLFHIALIVMLVAFAGGQLFKSEGGKLVVEGDGFANTITQYDDFKSGSLFDDDDLTPFSFDLQDFVGTYERNGPQRGTPRTYEARVTYAEGADGETRKKVIEVNKPLVVDGTKVYLNAHGYAPVISVKDGEGKEVYRSAVPLLPIDNNVTSTGAIKVMDGYKDKNGKKSQLGFQAFFVPTFAGDGQGTMFSQYPGLDYPVLALNGYYGSLGVDSGLPQNVYQLDTSKMKEFKDSNGDKLKKRLRPGETMKLPDGAGSITFESVEEWASFQITRQPASGWALTGAVAAIIGLAGSLFIQRRRVWVRAVRGADGVTVVEMAGLGRSESAKLPEELTDLAVALHTEAPTASGPDPDHRPEQPSEEPAEGAEK
ncbi:MULTISPECIES: cytochrome c biogenesis protein ResB [Streptomyces]|uniref:Cytochrome c biogenesis protein ResB n=1 Tax=Streptomyces glycanivorans TaxID=3033808 RepID=A0ABY9JDG9_9ACTN|nr:MULTISPECIES: cytochrome c biogenesis protein ResB [unclassified Streptomyces]WSQ79225.1 cytochrome c biogenesis protein ResB [Streptomyces sp. NBC_01213]TXS17435.1 cytochrome c biogenesis protein ResB [Streptomyces sp. wa22]WLQ65810.1 cytochrome c biogenesis protein ResB [Streptomyces sp. Alt3]WSQ86593.1 cytochrome c biogenesis protein ResB [Streptomyces sp. NBC_01212]WSR07357.1 cytochrome c biogenesis protein ResB [Streptomyces sp. NBC_01208]